MSKTIQAPEANGNRKLAVLDLFSGIGGFSLGLERTGGFETVAFCEIEEFPRKVLAKHWPDVPCYDDVRTLTAERLAADGIAVDVICGGFPCQDISTAGKGAGLAGERSGLWSEIARLVGELAPRFVVVENVAALLSRGLGDVLGDLASLGYDAEWHCIPACAVGAPHRRDRVWIVAYPCNDGHRADHTAGENSGATGPGEGQGDQWQRLWPLAGRGGEAVAHSEGERCGEAGQLCERPEKWPSGCGEVLADTSGLVFQGIGITEISERASWTPARQAIVRSSGGSDTAGSWWAVEPDVGRVANGVPDRAHRLKALGNAVVPQIPELIGNAILESIGFLKEAA